MINQEEKRDFHRVKLDSVCSYTTPSNKNPTQASLKDLSSSGILLWVCEKMTVGDEITITITPLNTITQSMSAEAQVTRCEQVDIDTSKPRYALACNITQIF